MHLNNFPNTAMAITLLLKIHFEIQLKLNKSGNLQASQNNEFPKLCKAAISLNNKKMMV